MALWKPSNLEATLTAWQQAGDPNDLSAATVSVSTWADSSGNGNDLVQSNSANQPQVFVLNGLNVLDFNSAQNDHMDYGDLDAMDVGGANPGEGDFYMALVFRPDNNATNTSNGNPELGNMALLAKHSGSDDYLLRIARSTQRVQQYIGSTSGPVVANGTTDIQAATTYILMGYRFNGNSIIRLDGVQEAIVANTNDLDNSRLLHVGGQATAGTASNYDGLICEIVMGGGTIGAIDIIKLEGYLNRRFALDNLPAANTYSDFAPAIGLHGVHNQDLIGELLLDLSAPLVSDTLAAAL